MARSARKAMADARALEEEAERMNPVSRKGVPSMGLSQMRGGAAVPSTGLSAYRGGSAFDYDDDDVEYDEEEELTGGGLAEEEDGEELVGGAHADEEEEEEQLEGGGKHTLMDHIKHPRKGYGTKKGQMRKTAHLAFEKKEVGGRKKMSEACGMGLQLGKHLHSLHGGSFFDDFRKGLEMTPLAGAPTSPATGKYEGKGKVLPGVKKPVKKPVMEVSGGDMERVVGCGKKRRAAAGPNDGRRARAAIVRKVMAEKQLSMIDASRYVKEHGLYTPA